MTRLDMFLKHTGLIKQRSQAKRACDDGRVVLVGPSGEKTAKASQAVHVGERVLMQEVAAGQGFGSSNSPYLIFGLGKDTSVDKVSITWPSKATQSLPELAADQALVVTEGQDSLRRVY